jgi:hypothetical protein
VEGVVETTEDKGVFSELGFEKIVDGGTEGGME